MQNTWKKLVYNFYNTIPHNVRLVHPACRRAFGAWSAWMRAWRSATVGAGAAMAAANAWLWVVVTMIQTFGGFFVSLVQQKLSEELVLVINPKSIDLVCRNSMAEATNQHCKWLILRRGSVLYSQRNSGTNIVEVGHPLVCWLIGLGLGQCDGSKLVL